MLVTVLIPCHNEEDALPPLFEALQELPKILGPDHFPEILFVDDGSTDQTLERLNRLADAFWFPVRVLGLTPNRGLGAAIRDAAPLAAGELIATYDADRAYPLQDLRKLVDLITSGADLATASPWHTDGKAEAVPIFRSLLSKAVSRAYRLRLGKRAQGLHTFTCGFRAYRRATLLAALPSHNGFVATAEILLRALRGGAKAAEVPSTLRARTEGKSKMKTLKTALAHLRLLVKNAPAGSSTQTAQGSK